MSYGNVARVYALCEYLAFGRTLQCTRESYLDEIEDDLKGGGKRVLILGGGDGRFLEALLKRTVDAEIDFIEISQRMIDVAKKRLVRSGVDDAQVSWLKLPFQQWQGEGYDLVTAHFYMDNFEGVDADKELEKVVRSLKAGGHLIVSDFDPGVACWARWMVRLMQSFFKLTCGVRSKDFTLPHAVLMKLGLQELEGRKRLRGFIFTTKWKKC